MLAQTYEITVYRIKTMADSFETLSWPEDCLIGKYKTFKVGGNYEKYKH